MNANKTHNNKRLLALAAVLVVCMLSLVTVAYAYNATYTTTVNEQDDVQLVSDASYVTIRGSLAYPTVNDNNKISITTAAEYTTSTTSSGTTYTVASAEYSVDNENCTINVDSGSAYLTVYLGEITLTNHSSAAVTVALSADGTFATPSSTTTCAFDLVGRAVSDSILFKASDASDYATQFVIAAPTPDSSTDITTYGTVTVGVYVSAPLTSVITDDGSSKTTDAYLPAIKDLVISAEDVSGNVSGLQGKTASVNITAACKDENSTATAPVTVSFSKVPSDAANLTASYTTNSTTKTVTLSLGLTDSDGDSISDLDGTATVTATLSGDYSGYDVMYYSTSDSSAQPTGVSAVYGSTAGTTTVTFTTTHFSDFAVYRPGTDSDGNSYFPVSCINDFQAAVNADLNVILMSNLEGDLLSPLTLQDGSKLIVNLNQKTLKNTNGSKAVYVTDSSVLTFKNGNLNTVDQAKASNASFASASGGSIILDNVNYTAGISTCFFPKGDTTAITINNSTVSTSGTYVVATNAASSDNYGVVITITSSNLTTNRTNSDASAVFINVGGTLNISDSTITGPRNALVVRAGVATVSGTHLVSALSLDNKINSYVNEDWKDGNEVPEYPVVVGDTKSNAYNADASLTLTNVTILNTYSGSTDGVSARYVYMADDATYSASLIANSVKVGTSASSLTDLTNDDIVKDNRSLNNTKITININDTSTDRVSESEA